MTSFLFRYIASAPQNLPVQANHPGLWQGQFILGAGGDGKAILWVKIDNSGKILTRVVEKLITLGDRWDDSEWWVDGKVGSVLKESAIHEFLSAGNNAVNFPRWLGTKLSPRHRVGHIWMEYCSHGDLQDIILNHANLRPARPIPEAFVWYAFRQLTEACVALNTSTRARPDATCEEGETTIHQDLKPNNILLTDPKPDYFPMYPVLKIGDFGRAEITYPTAPDNPKVFRIRWHTPGYAPCELWNGNKPDDQRPDSATPGTPVSEKTNVWQVGACMLALIRLNSRIGQIDYHNVTQDEREPTVDDFNTLRWYSAELRNLIRKCLRWDPTVRPSPQDLLQDVCLLMQDAEHAMGSYKAKRTWRCNEVEIPDDKYALGMLVER